MTDYTRPRRPGTPYSAAQDLRSRAVMRRIDEIEDKLPYLEIEAIYPHWGDADPKRWIENCFAEAIEAGRLRRGQVDDIVEGNWGVRYVHFTVQAKTFASFTAAKEHLADVLGEDDILIRRLTLVGHASS